MNRRMLNILPCSRNMGWLRNKLAPVYLMRTIH
nr:MAG TPA_asm: hypothetical protein [Caudoviricetes sp.]